MAPAPRRTRAVVTPASGARSAAPASCSGRGRRRGRGGDRDGMSPGRRARRGSGGRRRRLGRRTQAIELTENGSRLALVSRAEVGVVVVGDVSGLVLEAELTQAAYGLALLLEQ